MCPKHPISHVCKRRILIIFPRDNAQPKRSMGDSYMQLKVQSIGVIDAVLTASLLAALIFQSGVTLWHNTEASYESSVRVSNVKPTLKEFLDSLAAGKNTNNQSGARELAWTWTSSSTTTEEDASSRDMRFWWWLFHDVVFGVGLALILGAALALVRSTSLVSCFCMQNPNIM